MPAITIRALGAKGVNVDASPSLLDDAELRDSQNFFHESTDAHGGALRTRRGFTPFVLSSLGAPILGGIGMAVRGTARATSSPLRVGPERDRLGSRLAVFAGVGDAVLAK